jgi:hypothetical protein
VNNTTAASQTLEVIKHARTQKAVAHDRLNRSNLNKYEHAAKVVTNLLIYIKEVLHSQIIHRKISTLTFGTNLEDLDKKDPN